MSIDGNHNWNAEFITVADVLDQIWQAMLDQIDILTGVFAFQWSAWCDSRTAAVHFQGSYGRDQDDSVWNFLRSATFDIEKFLHANVRPETGFRQTKTISANQFQSNVIGHNRWTAMSDIRKWAGVHENRCSFECLH